MNVCLTLSMLIVKPETLALDSETAAIARIRAHDQLSAFAICFNKQAAPVIIQ